MRWSASGDDPRLDRSVAEGVIVRVARIESTRTGWPTKSRVIRVDRRSWIVLAVLYAAYYVRLTRSQMLETLGSDYIRTARAKGLTERVVIGRHAFRAGLSPIVTSAGLDLAGLLGGAIFIEAIFTIPGIGSLSLDSVLDADLPVLVGTTLVAAIFVVVANFIVDVLYAVLDPRVKIA